MFSEGTAAVPLSCAGFNRWNYYDEIHFMIWTPLILVCGSLCAYAWDRAKRTAQPTEDDRQQVFCNFQKRAFYIAFLFFPSTVSTLSRIFFCTEEFPDGTRWLLADLSLECDDPYWEVMMGVTIFGLLLCGAFILWLAWLARDELPFGLDKRVRKPTLVEQKMQKELFGAYRDNRKFKEAFECVRRVALTLGVYACGKTPASRAWGGAILSLAFTLAHTAGYISHRGPLHRGRL